MESLAIADQQQVLKAWEGLGYYSRARNFHRAAKIVMEKYNGQFPRTTEAAEGLPGIGRTTAGGILSNAFNLPIPILDGNVKRVLSRLIALPVPPPKAMDALWLISEFILSGDCPRDFNQALMDLGATVCLRKKPLCLICPWMSYCQAYQTNQTHTIPMTESKGPLPRKVIGVAVIGNDKGEILIDRRLEEGLLGGLWEFPGGKIEDGETPEVALILELEDELGINTWQSCLAPLTFASHSYESFHLLMPLFACRKWEGTPQSKEGQTLKWVKPKDLKSYPMPAADIPLIPILRDWL